jgi:deazaflavin-dependent oxidoreductase (nitroreductase family)
VRFADHVARFNRRVTNPIQRLWAGWLPPFAIIENVGRRSGKAYRTPVGVFAVPGGFAVFLIYGPDRDWVRNLVAAGGCKLVNRARIYEVTDPCVVPAAEAVEFLGKRPAALLRRLNVEYVLRLTSK